jgi:hypothetical protein
VFDSTFAPDRRRYVSQPGGLPAPALLDNHKIGRRIIEIGGFEYAADLAQHLILSEPVLIDISARSGCVCTGAAVGVPPLETRRTVVALEPPRSAQPIVEPGVPVMIDLPLAPPPDGDGPEPTFVEPDANDSIPDDTGERIIDSANANADTASPTPTRHRPDGVVVERRHAERRRVFDHTFDLQFDSAFRSAFDDAPASWAAPIEITRAEPLVAVAERSMVESVLSMRRRHDDAATAAAFAGPYQPAATEPAAPTAPAYEPIVPIETLTFAEQLADHAVVIPINREPRVLRPRPHVPRLVAVQHRPVRERWRRTTRWFRRIPASTYIISFAAVTAAAVFVGITVRARHTFQLTAQQPH